MEIAFQILSGIIGLGLFALGIYAIIAKKSVLRIVSLSLFLLFLLFWDSLSHKLFDNSLCGEPEEKKKAFIDSINIRYSNSFKLKHVPCYNDYMQIDLKTPFNESLIDSIEKAYEKRVCWAEFLVYDKDGKLIRGNKGSM